MKITSLFAVLIFLVVGCSEKSDTSSPTSTTTSLSASAIPASISKEQAVAIILELPEIKAWANYIEQTTEGKAHGSTMAQPEEPRTIDEKKYWTVSFYENQPAQMHRWETFLVSLDSKTILVDDILDDVISLQEWRDNKKPMERIQVKNAP